MSIHTLAKRKKIVCIEYKSLRALEDGLNSALAVNMEATQIIPREQVGQDYFLVVFRFTGEPVVEKWKDIP